MKGGLIFFAYFFCIILISANILAEITKEGITGEVITGEIITGEASQDVGLSIQMVAVFPTLSLISPKNLTYLYNTSILLNYTASSNVNIIWYNLDNSMNITIDSPTYFNFSQGNHTLYLFANNSDGNVTSKNVSFASIQLIILYEEYLGQYKGDSTNFNSYPYEELQTLSGVILENTLYGKVLFQEIINVTDDANFLDSFVDLDTNVNISSNRIELNTSALPNFNKFATVWLYNLSFSNPRILKNGEICPPSICTFESFSSSTLKFNVTEFASYSAEEIPSIIVVGGSSKGRKKISVNKQIIQVSLKQGEVKKEKIILKNSGSKEVNINILNPDLKGILNLSEKTFNLSSGEEKEFLFDIIAEEDLFPNLYFGRLVFKSGELEEIVLIRIEVQSKKSLFDVNAKILEDDLVIFPGNQFSSEIEISSLEDIGDVELKVEYYLKNINGDTFFEEEEIIAFKNKLNFIKKFNLISNLTSGDYVLYVKVSYLDNVASSSVWFKVLEEDVLETPLKNNFDFLYAILMVFILIVLTLFLRSKLKKKKRKI